MAERGGSIHDRLARVPEREWKKGAGLDALLKEAREPFVLRGLVADWPLVAAGRESAPAARRHLLDPASDRPFSVERTSVTQGKGVLGRGDLGCSRTIKQNKSCHHKTNLATMFT